MEKIVISEQVEFMPFPIPGATSGKLSARLLNVDLALGPVFFEIKLEAGAFIPRHVHHKTDEGHYVLEGEFINDGIVYGAGAFFIHDAGQAHGPHETTKGCRILVTQGKQVDPTDFEIVHE